MLRSDVKMEVDIISQEIIKPSLPTPDHLRIFKRSFIDQITGRYLVKLVSFYPRNETNLEINEVTNQLKTSLAQTLTHYYPLAGVNRDDSSDIECNDKGALFVTAHVHCNMNELIDPPDFQQFQKLGNCSTFYEDGSFQVYVQFNTFSCGGIAIFMYFCHMIVDMTTFIAFLNCWAATCSGPEDDQSACNFYPQYESAMLFPAKDSVPFGLSVLYKGLLLEDGRSIRKRFAFSAAAISDLKVKGSSGRVQEPTSFEVVSSFIWKHAMAAANVAQGVQQPSILVQTLDLRRRMVPSLPKYSAGNIISLMIAEYDGVNEFEVKFERLVELLRFAKEKTTGEFAPKLLSSGGYDVMIEFLEEWGEKCGNNYLNTYQFFSWCKMGLNEVDFGWGKPIWTTPVEIPEAESVYKNIVGLVDGSDGGIDAWIILEQQRWLCWKMIRISLLMLLLIRGLQSGKLN